LLQFGPNNSLDLIDQENSQIAIEYYVRMIHPSLEVSTSFIHLNYKLTMDGLEFIGFTFE
jgi:hypothetical protein